MWSLWSGGKAEVRAGIEIASYECGLVLSGLALSSCLAFSDLCFRGVISPSRVASLLEGSLIWREFGGA